MAGSSAIVTATLKCLMAFFGLTEADLPKELQPQFILDVEKSELNISAGLQDRVIQVRTSIFYIYKRLRPRKKICNRKKKEQ